MQYSMKVANKSYSVPLVCAILLASIGKIIKATWACVTPTWKSMSDYIDTITTKRYRLYLKEEQRKERCSEWTQYVTAAILWLVKLITKSLEKVNLKSKRVIEKVTVE
jgi:hypothetical protein